MSVRLEVLGAVQAEFARDIRLRESPLERGGDGYHDHEAQQFSGKAVLGESVAVSQDAARRRVAGVRVSRLPAVRGMAPQRGDVPVGGHLRCEVSGGELAFLSAGRLRPASGDSLIRLPLVELLIVSKGFVCVEAIQHPQ